MFDDARVEIVERKLAIAVGPSSGSLLRKLIRFFLPPPRQSLARLMQKARGVFRSVNYFKFADVEGVGLRQVGAPALG